MEENNDANTGTEAEDTGSSPDVELQPIVDEEGLISTVEYETVEKPEADSADDTSDGAEQNPPDQQSEDKDFNEHPRFKELINQKNEYKAKAEKAAALEQKVAQYEQNQRDQQAQQKPQYENVLKWQDEDIIDKFTNDPKTFLKKYGQQLFHEFQDQQGQAYQQQQQKNTQQRAFQNQAEFFNEDPAAAEMLNNGQIKTFLADNPGHNPISAFYAIAGEAVYQGKIDEAVAEAKTKLTNELKAKGNAASFSSTPGSKTINPSSRPEIKNPDKFGGRNAVMLKLLRERNAG